MFARALLATLALAIAACTTPEPSRSPSPIPPQALRPLPTLHSAPLLSGVLQGCGGIGLAARLHGDPGAERVAWLSGFRDGRRTEIAWPDGYRGRFVPKLEVLDPTGSVVLREGDFIDGACIAGDPIAMLLQPPFLGLILTCGPLQVDDCTGSRVHSAARAAGWPSRDIRTLSFTSVEGDLVVQFEDGTTVALRVRPN